MGEYDDKVYNIKFRPLGMTLMKVFREKPG